MSNLWGHIPADLRDLAQWCIAGADKRPLTLISGKLSSASTTEPGTWMSFLQAAEFAYNNSMQIGFVLSEADPFSVVDLDVKDTTPPDQWDVMVKTISHMNSYTEKSMGGKGFHIWARGDIGRGVRNWGMEIYSKERFMICTGNVTNDVPIAERQLQLESMANYLRPKRSEDENTYDLGDDEPQEVDDWYILQTGLNAANGDKFSALYGCRSLNDIHACGHPSQSEADLSFMSMLGFYSGNNAQVKRIFRASWLGSRDKAQDDDVYVNRTLRKIRARQAKELQADFSALSLTAAAVQQIAAEKQLATLQPTSTDRYMPALQVPQQPVALPIPNSAAIIASAAPVAPEIQALGDEGLPWPPGLAGQIAYFVYRSAPRPVKEIAIVAALGLLSGLCGKAWNIPQSGLNNYIVLVARSAIGKEAMNSGLSKLQRAVQSKNPRFGNYLKFGEFVSAPALRKYLNLASSFCHVSGEFGKKLARMARSVDGRDTQMDQLRTLMTDLYQKSSADSIVGSWDYSDAEKNAISLSGVAYSMIGETTPETFYKSLTSDMMEDGFMSRLLIVEYNGIRVPQNKNAEIEPDPALVQILSDISFASDKVINALAKPMQVQSEIAVSELIAQFDSECDDLINDTKDESVRQMYNRAALKAQRIAALLAVADRYSNPIINLDHIRWAIDVVRRDIKIMNTRMSEGEVGLTDTTRERKLRTVIRTFLSKDLPQSYSKYQRLKDVGIIPRAYLQPQSAQFAAFQSHRNGPTPALDSAIKSLCDSGFIREVDKDTMKKHNYHGKVYQILNIEEN